MEIGKEIVQLFEYDLTLTLYLPARLTLTLIFSFCYLLLISKKLTFRKKSSCVKCNFSVVKKIGCLMWK